MILLDDFTGPGLDDGTFGDSGFGGPDMGIPGIFWFFFVLVLVLGIASFFWKIAAARDLATRAGMDPDEATAMTVLTDGGLEATYVASQVRTASKGIPPFTPPAVAERPAAERLTELKALLDSGAITEAEYAARRQAIIDSV